MSSHDSDFRQFNGSFDREIEPGTVFTAQLQKRLRVEVPAAQPPQQLLASPPKSEATVPPPRRRQHPLMIAAAVLAIISISFSGIWLVSERELSGQYGGPPEVVLPLNSSVTPGADVSLTPRLIVRTSDMYGTYAVADGVIVGSSSMLPGEDEYTATQLYALDADSGDLLWTHPGWFGYSIFSDDHFIYLLKEDENQQSVDGEGAMAQEEASDSETTDGVSLLALDPRTGVVQWEYDLPPLTFSYGDNMYWASPIIADGVIYLANWQTVIAIDAVNGSEMWQESVQFSGASNGDKAVSLSSYDGHVVVIGVGGDVLVLTSDVGKEVARYKVDPGVFVNMEFGASVQVASSGLGTIAVWTGYGPDSTKSVTMLIEPMTGEILSSVVTDGSSGVIASAEDSSVAFVPNQWQSVNFLMRLFGRSGTVSFSLVWIDTVEGSLRLRTEYAPVGEFPAMVVANNGDYACYAATSLSCYDKTGTRFVITDDDVYWAQTSGSQLFYATRYGIYEVTLP
ncbi:MAG: PQQ-binding-like beta-propeller repeat protein [Thermomicrobiales bacterium]|nr:PQQ-binding-like beta-propeller repeat protein [Thermomicrobiales bacterium]